MSCCTKTIPLFGVFVDVRTDESSCQFSKIRVVNNFCLCIIGQKIVHFLEGDGSGKTVHDVRCKFLRVNCVLVKLGHILVDWKTGIFNPLDYLFKTNFLLSAIPL
ncbi:ORF229 [White spot syndrome virus]|uniref:ORF229 n=1 Tax=White spot syndrome virus TaxID=342409 RepID=A0A2D3I5G7_9VIRU|nr:ORF229 [White spot syndrome virus]